MYWVDIYQCLGAKNVPFLFGGGGLYLRVLQNRGLGLIASAGILCKHGFFGYYVPDLPVRHHGGSVFGMCSVQLLGVAIKMDMEQIIKSRWRKPAAFCFTDILLIIG